MIGVSSSALSVSLGGGGTDARRGGARSLRIARPDGRRAVRRAPYLRFRLFWNWVSTSTYPDSHLARLQSRRLGELVLFRLGNVGRVAKGGLEDLDCLLAVCLWVAAARRVDVREERIEALVDQRKDRIVRLLRSGRTLRFKEIVQERQRVHARSPPARLCLGEPLGKGGLEALQRALIQRDQRVLHIGGKRAIADRLGKGLGRDRAQIQRHARPAR